MRTSLVNESSGQAKVWRSNGIFKKTLEEQINGKILGGRPRKH